MLLGCLSIQAANDDLITKQITIKLDKAGTLPNKIAISEMYKITNLKIIGEINGTDWNFIREMAGQVCQATATSKSRIAYRSNTGRNGQASQLPATIKSTPAYRSNTGREGQACQSTATIKNIIAQLIIRGIIVLAEPNISISTSYNFCFRQI